MRINPADVDLWRARETQGTRRLSEAASTAALGKRTDAELRRTTGGRRQTVNRTSGLSAIPPLEDQLADTAGNVAILRHLIDRVLPALPMPDDVRQMAASLFADDMIHHLRVLDSGPGADEEPRS